MEWCIVPVGVGIMLPVVRLGMKCVRCTRRPLHRTGGARLGPVPSLLRKHPLGQDILTMSIVLVGLNHVIYMTCKYSTHSATWTRCRGCTHRARSPAGAALA